MSVKIDDFSGRVTYLGTGIGDLEAAKRDLKPGEMLQVVIPAAALHVFDADTGERLR